MPLEASVAASLEEMRLRKRAKGMSFTRQPHWEHGMALAASEPGDVVAVQSHPGEQPHPLRLGRQHGAPNSSARGLFAARGPDGAWGALNWRIRIADLVANRFEKGAQWPPRLSRPAL